MIPKGQALKSAWAFRLAKSRNGQDILMTRAQTRQPVATYEPWKRWFWGKKTRSLSLLGVG